MFPGGRRCKEYDSERFIDVPIIYSEKIDKFLS